MILTIVSITDSPQHNFTPGTMEVDIARLVLLLHLVTTPALSSQSFSSQPSDVTVSLGSDLTLPCVVVGRRGEVQVRKDVYKDGI